MYRLVLRMVLWGEPKEEVIHKLEVNGITGSEAEEMYRNAFKERVATIRSSHRRNLLTGLIFIGAALGSFCFLWYYVGGITHWLLLICAAAAAIGIVKLLVALFGIMGAASKEGSVSE